LILVPLISFALYSCGGNEQTTTAALAAMNIPEMVGDSTAKKAVTVSQKETTVNKEKSEKEHEEEKEKEKEDSR
jgi:hypothetical protein